MTGCRACHRAGTDACTATFTCIVCEKEKNICHYLVGGFEAGVLICSACHLRLFTGLRVRDLRHVRVGR